MFALDKVIVSVRNIKNELIGGIDKIDLVKTKILTKFDLKDSPRANNKEKIYPQNNGHKSREFNHINYIEIEKVRYEFFNINIEYNYSKFFNKTNFIPIKTQSEKELVDSNIKELVSEILGIDKKYISFEYSYLEAAKQMKVIRFSDYNNVFNLLYRGLVNFTDDEIKIRCLFDDFSKRSKREFRKGFAFSFGKGLKFIVYNKSLENNMKVLDIEDMVKETALKGEFKISKSNLKKIAQSADMDTITLPHLKKSIPEFFYLIIKKVVLCQLEENKEELEKRLKRLEKVTPRILETFVVENNEWILDYDFIGWILKYQLKDSKPERTIQRYQKIAKDKLIRLETSNSPKRSNSKNMKKLELLVEELFGIKLNIKLCENGEIQVF